MDDALVEAVTEEIDEDEDVAKALYEAHTRLHGMEATWDWSKMFPEGRHYWRVLARGALAVAVPEARDRESLRKALTAIKALKPEPIGDTGFVVGPQALLNVAKRIARDALSASRKAANCAVTKSCGCVFADLGIECRQEPSPCAVCAERAAAIRQGPSEGEK